MDTPPAASTSPSVPSGEQKPKTFIRTLAGDIEAVKKGGIPGFTPLRERPKTPPAPPVAPPPMPPPEESSTPTPMPKLTLVPPSPPTVVPSPVAAPEVPPRPVGVNQLASVIKKLAPQAPLKTYSGDFSDRMKKMKASTATVLAAEQDSAPIVEEATPKKTSLGSILYGTAGVLLLVAGGVGVYIAYGRYLSAFAPIMLTPTVPAPIFVDDREPVTGTGTALLQNIEQSVASPLAGGAVRLLYLADATTTSVFLALQEPAPGILLRNITTDQGMAGVVDTGGVQSLFFILSVTSYSDTFAGMLLWEPKMPRDLSKLFHPYPQTSVSTTTSATSTPTVHVFTPGFHDEVVANHDTRVYRDAAGRAVLLYGYWNQTTLVIARDAAAFVEIIGRLATSRAQ